MDTFAATHEFSLLPRKTVVTDFTGGNLSSDGGLLPLADLDRRIGFTQGFAACLQERRQPGKVRHSLQDLARQRIYQIACGYEDANDAGTLRSDPVFKTAVGRSPEGGLDLGSQPTLSRLENEVTQEEVSALRGFLVEHFVRRHRKQRALQIVLDIDATDDPTYGQQELRYYNGHYGTYCFLPLHVYATLTVGRGKVRRTLSEQELVFSLLRPASRGGAYKAAAALKFLVQRLKKAWPRAQIIVRGDGGFSTPRIVRTLDREAVGYCLGFARNQVLERLADSWRDEAWTAYWAQPKPEGDGMRPALRRFGRFSYRAGTWGRPRQVVVKAEVVNEGENPRFVVCSRLPETLADPETIYSFYCERGDRENRIKEYKCDLRAGRTSCHAFLANQFRLLLHAGAYVLFQALRSLLAGTEWASAQVRTLQLKLIKVAARVRESHRRVYVQFASSYPYRSHWNHLARAIAALNSG